MTHGKLWQGLMLIALVGCLGCSRAEEPAPGGANAATGGTSVAEATDADSAAASASTGGGSPVIAEAGTGDASTPDGAVKRILSGFTESKPRNTWDALPARYQADLHEVVHTFAENTDPEIWNRSIGILRKFTETAKAKKALLLTMAAQKHPTADSKQVEAALDSFVALFEGLAASDLGDLERLKKADLAVLWTGTMTGVIDAMRAVFELAPPQQRSMLFAVDHSTVELVSQNGDTAVVTVKAEGAPPEEHELTRVDGKWLPTHLVASWDTTMVQWKEKAAAPSQLTDEQKQMLHGVLDSIESGLDTIAGAKTEEELTAAVMQMAGPLMMLGSGMGGPGAGPPPGSSFERPTAPDDGDEAKPDSPSDPAVPVDGDATP